MSQRVPPSIGSRSLINRLFIGSGFCPAIALTLFVGYAAQIVTVGLPYKNLEGAIFGTRVGCYVAESLSLIHISEPTRPY